MVLAHKGCAAPQHTKGHKSTRPKPAKAVCPSSSAVPQYMQVPICSEAGGRWIMFLGDCRCWQRGAERLVAAAGKHYQLQLHHQ